MKVYEAVLFKTIEVGQEFFYNDVKYKRTSDSTKGNAKKVNPTGKNDFEFFADDDRVEVKIS